MWTIYEGDIWLVEGRWKYQYDKVAYAKLLLGDVPQHLWDVEKASNSFYFFSLY